MSEIENEEVVVDETAEEVISEEPGSEESTDQVAEEPIEGETGEEPAPYAPNLKYSYMDNEFDFDERVAGQIKTKEDEDYYRDLMTSKKAFDQYKEMGSIRDLSGKIENYDSYAQKAQQFDGVNQEIDMLMGHLQKGNFEAFRKHLAIDKKAVLEWAIGEAKYQEADPTTKAAIDHQRQIEEQNFNLQNQNNQLQSNYMQAAQAQRDRELETQLGESDVARAFDAVQGTNGAFRKAVIDHAQLVWNQQQRDLSVGEAVQAVSEQWKGLLNQAPVGTQPQSQQTNGQNNPQNTVVIQGKGQKTLPNIAGGNSSPAKKRITSLDGLRELSKTM